MKTTYVGLAMTILTFLCVINECVAQTNPPPIPNPILYFIGQEGFSRDGKSFVRYRYDVFNSGSFPDSLFAAAPTLPPCGTNTKASRTWVDIFDQRGTRLNGFCAFGKSSHLGSIWFALEEELVPPSWIYIELTDRQTNTKYKSNLAETTN